MRAVVAEICRSVIVVSALIPAGCGGQSPPRVDVGQTPASPRGASIPKPESKWKTYQTDEGRFTVLLPGAPEVSTQPGQVFTVHIATFEQGDTRYFVTYCDPPPQAIAPEVVEATMKRDRDMSLRDTQGTLRKERKVTIPADGREWPGLESVMEDAANLWTSRLYAVGGRMYTLQVVHPKGRAREADIATFFDSFTPLGESGGRRAGSSRRP